MMMCLEGVKSFPTLLAAAFLNKQEKENDG